MTHKGIYLRYCIMMLSHSHWLSYTRNAQEDVKLCTNVVWSHSYYQVSAMTSFRGSPWPPADDKSIQATPQYHMLNIITTMYVYVKSWQFQVKLYKWNYISKLLLSQYHFVHKHSWLLAPIDIYNCWYRG